MGKMLESLSGHVDVDFPEYEQPPAAPWPVVRGWIDVAVKSKCSEPLVMCLGTSSSSGDVSMRMMATCRLSDEGLVFATHGTSRKAKDISATHRGCALYYWREIGRQLSLSGELRLMSDEEADSIWFARHRGLHTMTTVSRQSQVLDDPDRLRAQDEALAKRMNGQEEALPRPASFVVFELVVDGVEFWSACSDRLHKRLRYERDRTGWSHVRLQP